MLNMTKAHMVLATAMAMGAAGMLGMVGSAMGQTYHVRDLGTLGGLGDTESFDIAGAGPMVVGFATGADSHHTAFIWNGTALTPILPIGGDTQSAAFGVDGLGRVIGMSYSLGEPDVHALRWDAGAVSPLGNFTPRGVNAAGDIVGFLPVMDSWGLRQDHACVLLEGAGTPVDLGTLFGASWSQAYAINAQRMVAGITAGTADQGTRAAVWYNGAKVDLGTLGGTTSAAYAINDTGIAVGWSDIGGTTPNNRAAKFLLDANGNVVSRINMGALPATVQGAGVWSYAYGVNNAGQVVGQSNGRAFVDVGVGMQDLNGLVPSAPGWFLVSARSVDESGRIAAWGVDGLGRPRPVVLAPCDGDYDRNGTLSVQDVFEFLNGWFAGDARANMLHTGTLTVQDVFEFLMRWFAGCPF
jgi:probable HAF family extracellular repeat protein